MASSNNMYLILRNDSGSRRTRGIRIEATKLRGIGLAFYAAGAGFEYQECLGNMILGDKVSYLKKKKVS